MYDCNEMMGTYGVPERDVVIGDEWNPGLPQGPIRQWQFVDNNNVEHRGGS